MKGYDSILIVSNGYNPHESHPPIIPLHRPRAMCLSNKVFARNLNIAADNDRQRKKISNLAKYLMNRYSYLSLKT